MARDTQTTGAAGTFYVAGELAQRGWNASLTMGNAERTDLVAQLPDGSRLAAIQVKTRKSGSFQLGSRSESWAPGENEWFVLCSLKDPDERPDFYVIPRLQIAAFIFVGYRAWLAAPGKRGQKRNATAMRTVQPAELSPYLEQWDLLNRPAEEAAWNLPDWWWDEAPVHLKGAAGWRGFTMPPRSR